MYYHFLYIIIHFLFVFRFDFISAPIVHPRYKREFLQVLPKRPGPLTRSDKVLTGSDWCSLVVAKLSPWIDLDSTDETVRRNSEKACEIVVKCNGVRTLVCMYYVSYDAL